MQDDLQCGDQLLRVDALLAAQRVQLLVQVGHLHAGLCEVAELLGQVRQQVLQVRGRRGGGGRLAVAPHGHHLLQLVVEGRVDGADGVFAAEEGLTACREEPDVILVQRLPLVVKRGTSARLSADAAETFIYFQGDSKCLLI